MPRLILIAASSYLFGSIPFGYLLIRICRGEDVRRSGSGNIGATNVARKSPALGVCTLHHRIADTGARDRALWVVDDEAARHLTEPLERPPMQPEPGGHALVEDELDVLVTRETQRHDERPRAAHLRRG